ncbi:YggT family protein [Motilibacter deserti]|uniref:YggT family protein n=1 Tax=Motilibacter deserti TaxID=2714956 RepID=A0ABX0GRE8_9ACTN|nr:YggT family protein [Motilibacter deserti]
MRTFGEIVYVLLTIYTFILIARLVLDYVQLFARSWRPRGVVLVVAEAIYSVTDPPLRALRQVIPPLRLGNVSLDLSFLVLIVFVQVLASVVRAVFIV